ncbi:ABC transporter ATP-binding protein [Actinoalloteichus caeruleus]|uniref:ABC transporter ATP-binding protein n=1 Tax=Actinoalloteichus cyanogriseus TaxID=2893586 RepID=UPI003AB071C6
MHRPPSTSSSPAPTLPERRGTALLEFRGLTVRFGDHVVLDRLDLALEAGRAVAVVGPNGAGKSTALRCAVGAEAPTSGEVLFDGAPLDETSPAFRASVAAALDDAASFPDLSVVEHLLVVAWAHGVDDPAVVDAAVVDCGLRSVRDNLPATLSSGQARRLALASCLVRPRRALVLDEPEQRLDESGHDWLRERLLAEKAAGTAVLFASHHSALVDAVADNVVTVAP